jgi:hypothetical protein
MKKLILIVAIALISFLGRAQDEAVIIKGSTKISHDLTPQQVIDSLNKRFPDANSVKYYKVSQQAVANGWTISKEDNLSHDTQIDYYTITFKSANLNYYGLFAADGRLIRSKQEHSVDDLPEKIKFSIKSLAAAHPGYKVVSKKYFKNLDASTSEEYYEIIAQKGDEKRSLYYKADGTLLEFKKD